LGQIVIMLVAIFTMSARATWNVPCHILPFKNQLDHRLPSKYCGAKVATSCNQAEASLMYT